MMSCYQKFYTNHIHSSSLLCQLATMWKSQVLCDAIIRTGNIITKAHRVVLVAACPMLQSMENASMGSHLEVRLASDIKQDSVHTFLQYLYEGYMMLTEENCKDVEKIARLLQVDSVIKCISDFYKCLSAKTGCVIDDRYKYSSFDLMEFKHVRSSSIQKTLPETALKRGSELNRPSSPGHKRQRLGRPSSPLMRSSQRADDTLSMAHSYGGSHGSREPWDQGGRLGGRVPPQPGVIDIVEDSIEIIQTDRNEKDPLRSDGRMKQKSVSIAVTSQYNTPTDLQVVSMGDPDGVSSNSTQQTSEMLHNSSSQGSITVSPIPLFSDTSSTSAHTKPSDIQQEMPSVRPNIPPSQPVFPTLTPMHRPPHSSSSKPFAAGSASQSFMSSSPQSRKADTLPSSNTNQDHKGENNSNDSNTPSTSADKAPDITIVKVESNTDHNTEGLDMYVDMPDDGIMRLQGMDDSQNDEGSDIEHVEQDQSADWSKEDMSNEGSNLGIDQNNSWYIDQFKEMAKLRYGPDTGLASTSFPSAQSGQGFGPNIQSSNIAVNQDLVRDLVAAKRLSYDNRSVKTPCESDSRLKLLLPPNVSACDLNEVMGDTASHRPVHTEQYKQKRCVLCRHYKNTTRSGWKVLTQYRCEKCDVALCTGERNCFVSYHQLLMPSKFGAPSVNDAKQTGT